MSKEIISSTRITKSYRVSSSSGGNNENQKISENEAKQSTTSKHITEEITKTIETEHSNQNTNLNTVEDKKESYKNYKVNTYQSSVGTGNQRSHTNQSSSPGGNKWKTNSISSYNKATIETNFTSGDDFREKSIKYKNNTYMGKNSSVNQNSKTILIHEEINTGYSNLGEQEESNKAGEIKVEQVKKSTDKEINFNKICTCDKDSYQGVQTGSNFLTISNTNVTRSERESEERRITQRQNIKKMINEEVDIEIIRKQIREQIHQELKEEINEEEISWKGCTFIQVMERMQYLAAQPPKLTIQFLNDMMIRRTVNNAPINVLIPLMENYMQRQGTLQVLSEEKEKIEEKIEFVAENVDTLNISQAYAVQTPAFNNLEIGKEEMIIKGQEIIEEPVKYELENHSWEIVSGSRLWTGPMQAIRNNKLIIEDPVINWNNIIQKELATKLEYEGIEEEEKVPEFQTMRFDLNFKENKKRFKNIELGNSEFIILHRKRKLDQSIIKWEPVICNAHSMTIENHRIKVPMKTLKTNNILMEAARKRRQDWNLVNKLSAEAEVDILAKEEEKVVEDSSRRFRDPLKQLKSINIKYYNNKAKWSLIICKEINIIYEQESDDVLINDDYNNIKGINMRPINATIMRIKDEDDTSSVSSYDIFQNIILKEKELKFDFNSAGSLLKNSRFYSRLKNERVREVPQGRTGGYERVKILSLEERLNNEDKRRGSSIITEGINMIRNSFEKMGKRLTWDNVKLGNFLNFWEKKEGKQNQNTIKLRASEENAEKQQYDKNAKMTDKTE